MQQSAALRPAATGLAATGLAATGGRGAARGFRRMAGRLRGAATRRATAARLAAIQQTVQQSTALRPATARLAALRRAAAWGRDTTRGLGGATARLVAAATVAKQRGVRRAGQDQQAGRRHHRPYDLTFHGEDSFGVIERTCYSSFRGSHTLELRLLSSTQTSLLQQTTQIVQAIDITQPVITNRTFIAPGIST